MAAQLISKIKQAHKEDQVQPVNEQASDKDASYLSSDCNYQEDERLKLFATWFKEVTTIEEIIRQTADPKFSDQDCGVVSGQLHPNAVYGYGRINAIKAIELALKTQTKVNEVDKTVAPLQIIPNPAFDHVIIGSDQDTPGNTKLRIFNAAGMMIYTKDHILTKGQNEVNVRLDNHITGL